MIFQKKTNKKIVLSMVLQVLLLFLILSFCMTRQAISGMVWQTTRADVKNGNIVSATSWQYGAAKLISIDYNDTTPNPCYKQANCFVRSVVFNNQQVSQPYTIAPGISTKQSEMASIGAFETMGQLYRFLSDTYSLNIGYTLNGKSPSNYTQYCDAEYELKQNVPCIYNDRWEAYSRICYGLGYNFSGSLSYTIFPGQSCIGPTPPNNECVVETGSVTVDHGELMVDAVNGNKKTQQVRISCTYAANADIAFYSKDANDKIILNSDGSLYSTVTVDGISGTTAKKITIPTSGATIVLESTLHTVGDVTEGAFSGTGILVVNNY